MCTRSTNAPTASLKTLNTLTFTPSALSADTASTDTDMDKYTIMALNRAGNWVNLDKCDSLAEAVRLKNEWRTTRGLAYTDYGIKFP